MTRIRAAATLSLLVQQEMGSPSEVSSTGSEDQGQFDRATVSFEVEPAMLLFECAKANLVLHMPGQPSFALDVIQCRVVGSCSLSLILCSRTDLLLLLKLAFGDDVYAEVRDMR